MNVDETTRIWYTAQEKHEKKKLVSLIVLLTHQRKYKRRKQRYNEPIHSANAFIIQCKVLVFFSCSYIPLFICCAFPFIYTFYPRKIYVHTNYSSEHKLDTYV